MLASTLPYRFESDCVGSAFDESSSGAESYMSARGVMQRIVVNSKPPIFKRGVGRASSVVELSNRGAEP